jgi:hypothetical protein
MWNFFETAIAGMTVWKYRLISPKPCSRPILLSALLPGLKSRKKGVPGWPIFLTLVFAGNCSFSAHVLQGLSEK